VPKRQNLDSACFSVDLIVEVVAGSAQVEATNSFSVRISSLCANSGLGGNEFERPLEVLGEGVWCCGPIGTPPSAGLSNLGCSAKGGFDD